MRHLRTVLLVVAVIAPALLPWRGAAANLTPGPQAGASTAPADFAAFLATVDAAQLELQNGRPGAFKALWSQADDVTLSGGFGGTIEKGWPAISRRLDWVGTQFANGSSRIERLVVNGNGDLCYVIQLEHLTYQIPATHAAAARDYRVTMIFRRESGAWRMVHRQADSQLTRQE